MAKHGETRSEIENTQKQLPVHQARKELLFHIKRHDTLVLVGETGSGKTTQVPQFLLQAGYGKLGTIAVTQPRRVAATTVASRVASEMQVELGKEVGYSVRFDDKTSPRTKIKFMTDGMMVRELMIDPKLKKYTVIVLDEAHERTLSTEVLFGLVKRLQKQRSGSERPLKVIVMSATLEAERFADFFLKPKIVHVPGRRFGVEVMYAPEPQPDFLDAAVVTILQIHMEEQDGDILCFLCGQDQIEDAAKVLTERSKSLPPSASKLLPCPLYAALPPGEQAQAFAPAPAGTRKVVLATNIAESSITIDGIRYVVDNGLVKARVYDPHRNMETLHEHAISKAQALQRTGRAGRQSAGKAFRLYTEEQFEELRASAVPEIKRCRLSSTVLQLLVMGVDNLLEFEFLEAPPRKLLAKALTELHELGAVDHSQDLTQLGRDMAMLPLEPVQAKLLLSSPSFNCSEEIATVIAMLSVESIFYSPPGKREQAARARAIFTSADGDHISFLLLYRAWRKSKSDKDWCQRHFVNGRNLRKVAEIRQQLVDYCTQARIEMVSCGEELTSVAKCLVAAFHNNAAQLAPSGRTYIVSASSQEVAIHPSSVLFNSKKPSVVFDELTFTTKLFMRNCTAIDASWLPDLAPHKYKRKASAPPDTS